MNPLELVAKTLYSFNEHQLTFELLDAFGKRAQVFQQYDEIAKCFFELKNFSKAIEYGEQSLKLAQTKEEKYTTSKNLINAYNQSNHPEKSITQIEKLKKQNPQDTELLLEETFAYSAINQKEKSEKLLFNLLQKKLPEEIERITGITNFQVEKCRDEFEVLKDFVQFVKEYDPDAIVGHNYDAFDGEFFKAKASFHFLNWPNIKTIDTLKIARQVKAPTTMVTPTGAPSYKQQSIAAGYGISYQAHSAIEDVKALIQIYNRMTGTQQRSVKRNLLGF